MNATVLAPPVERDAAGGGVPAAPTRRRGTDALVLGGFLLLAVVVTAPLWVSPGQRVAPLYQGDLALMQWYLAHAARALTHLENPLLTTMANVPDGVNLMANTSILGVAMPLSPVTLVFGPHVSLLLLQTLGPAGTAAGWYLVLSRRVVSSTAAAAVGGLVCGFAPPLVSHLNWHPNFTFQFLLPIIVWRVLELSRPGAKVRRNGIVLGLLVTYQAFINEELLLFTALGCGVFLTAVAVQDPAGARQAARPMLASLGVTALVAGSLLAYPLWVQFFGPMHYRGLFFQGISVDLASFTAFATESVAGSGEFVDLPRLAPNHAEENAFFGWPLLLLVGAGVVMLRRSVAARALTSTALVFALLALGPEVRFQGEPTGTPGPWAALAHLPLLESVLPTRFGLVVASVLGVLVALATQHVWDVAARRPPTARRNVRLLWAGLLACALVPAAPTPLEVAAQRAVPGFITEGRWRPHVGPGQTLLPVPFPTPHETVGLRWAAATTVGFASPGGYFVLPEDGVTGRIGTHLVSPRPTAQLLAAVATTGAARPVTEADRVAAEADLRFWRTSLVVLEAADPRVEPLRATLEGLLGPGRREDGVWVWAVGDPPAPGAGGRAG